MRCAYCHDELDPDHHRCEGCGTLLHLECYRGIVVCPTLGCAVMRPIPRIPMRIRPTLRPRGVRLAAWVLFGILLPLVAFFVDAGVRVDPLIWGEPQLSFLGGGLDLTRPIPYLRLALVWGGTLLSMLGLVLFLARRIRASLPLLALGVVVSGAHALAFVPLIPLSFVGIALAGLGLLGFLPFVSFWVFLDAAGRARALLQDDEGWGGSFLVAEGKWLKRRLVLIGGSIALLASAFAFPAPEPFYSPARHYLGDMNPDEVRAQAIEVVATKRKEGWLGPPPPLVNELADLADGSKVRVGSNYVRLDWPEAEADDDVGFGRVERDAHWIWILTEGQDLPPAGAGTRSVELAEGIWSQWEHDSEATSEPEFQHLPLW